MADVLTGDGSPTVDCLTMATMAATVTERVRIEFGVLIPALRPVVTLATQLMTLQHLARSRVVLGVGAGGFPDSPYWRAAQAPIARDRADRLEAMLTVLPSLITGQPTALGDGDPVTLAPPAPMPPVLVGGHSSAAVRRSVTHADGWFPSLMAPDTLAARVGRLRELAASRHRPRPRVHFGVHAALGPDADAQSAALRSSLTSTMSLPPADLAAVPITGSAVHVAEQLHAYAEAGADSITVSLDGADWRHQLDVLADARQLLQR